MNQTLLFLFFVALSQFGSAFAEPEDGPIYAEEFVVGHDDEGDDVSQVTQDVQRKAFAGRDLENPQWNFTVCYDEDKAICNSICAGDGFCAAAGPENQPDCYCNSTPVYGESVEYSCEKQGTVQPGDGPIEVESGPDQCQYEITHENFSTNVDFYFCSDPHGYFYCAFLESPQIK